MFVVDEELVSYAYFRAEQLRLRIRSASIVSCVAVFGIILCLFLITESALKIRLDYLTFYDPKGKATLIKPQIGTVPSPKQAREYVNRMSLELFTLDFNNYKERIIGSQSEFMSEEMWSSYTTALYGVADAHAFVFGNTIYNFEKNGVNMTLYHLWKKFPSIKRFFLWAVDVSELLPAQNSAIDIIENDSLIVNTLPIGKPIQIYDDFKYEGFPVLSYGVFMWQSSEGQGENDTSFRTKFIINIGVGMPRDKHPTAFAVHSIKRR